MTHKGERGMDAPERIYIDPDDLFNQETTFCTLAYGSVSTEYTRSDLYDALKAENERLRAALKQTETK